MDELTVDKRCEKLTIVFSQASQASSMFIPGMGTKIVLCNSKAKAHCATFNPTNQNA